MRDLRIYLEKLGKSLIRRGYEVPELTDFSEDGLFRYAKLLEGVLYFVSYYDFYGEMRKKFYEEFVKERDEVLRAEAEKESVDDVFGGVSEVQETSKEAAKEEVQSEEESKEAGYSENNPFLTMLNANSKIQSVDSRSEDEVNLYKDSQWADDDDLDAPHPSEEYDNDGLDVSNTDDNESENELWANDDDLDAPHPTEYDSEDGLWANDDDLDAPHSVEDEDSSDDVFDIKNELIEEVSKTDEFEDAGECVEKEEREERKTSETIKRNNQTIDMLGSLFSSTKKKGKKRND